MCRLRIAAFEFAGDAREDVGGTVSVVGLLVGGGVGGVAAGRPALLSARVPVERAPVRRLPRVETVRMGTATLESYCAIGSVRRRGRARTNSLIRTVVPNSG